MILTEEHINPDKNLEGPYTLIIKTNSDNKVIISLKEEKLYTKDEVIALCKQAYNDSNVDSIINGCCGQLDTAEPHINESFNKWIKDNL